MLYILWVEHMNSDYTMVVDLNNHHRRSEIIDRKSETFDFYLSSGVKIHCFVNQWLLKGKQEVCLCNNIIDFVSRALYL